MKKIYVMILLLCIYESAWATEIKLSCRYTASYGDADTVIISFDEENHMVDGESIYRHCSDRNPDLCYQGSITDTTVSWEYFHQGDIARRMEINRGTGEYTRTLYGKDGEVSKTPDGRERIARGSCSPFKKAF
jgi:hypothetical protein